ncbi:unnamed protein product [Prunus armeniaca]
MFGDEQIVLGDEMIGRTEESDRSLVGENSDSCDSCVAEFDARPLFAQPLLQSNYDSETSEVIPDVLSMPSYELSTRTTRGKPEGELGFGPKKPMNLYCDNKVAIAIIHNPIQHDRTKHVEVDQHFIKEKLDDGIAFPFMNSEYQLADVLTKAVATTIFLNSLDKLGMRDIFAPT